MRHLIERSFQVRDLPFLDELPLARWLPRRGVNAFFDQQAQSVSFRAGQLRDGVFANVHEIFRKARAIAVVAVHVFEPLAELRRMHAAGAGLICPPVASRPGGATDFALAAPAESREPIE